MTCPRCEGRDLTQAGFRLVNRGEAGCTVEAHPPCEMCGGSGQITEAHAERWRLGQGFHDARMILELPLMNCSNVWGGTPAQWSKAERLGIGEPWIFGRMSAYLLWDGDPPEQRVRERTAHYEALAAEEAG